MENKDQFTEWYKQRYEVYHEQAPDDVWNKIADHMDLDATWKQVDVHLSVHKKRKTFIRVAAYSIAFLLLIVSGSLLIIRKKTLQDKQSAYNISGSVADFANGGNENGKILPLVVQNQPARFNEVNTEKESRIQAAFLPVKKNKAHRIQKLKPNRQYKTIPSQLFSQDPVNKERNAVVYKEGNTLALENNPPVFIPAREIKEIDVAGASYLPSQITLTDSSFVRSRASMPAVENEFNGKYAGVFYAINNIWLLNGATFRGFGGNSLQQTNLNYGYSYGISAGYNFRTKWGLGFNWYVHSQQGQAYHVYEDGFYLERKIIMDFTSVVLLGKYRNPGYNALLHIPQSFNLIAGINIGFLQKGEEQYTSQYEKEVADIRYSCSKTDYGFNIGYEYEILAWKRILVSSALTANIGIKNIYKSDHSVFHNSDHTHTASLGIVTGMKYIIK